MDGEDQERLSDRSLFGTVDAQRLARQMDLVNVGAQRGMQEQPASDHAGFDQVEASIAGEIQAIRAQARQDVLRRLRAINESISKDRSRISTSNLEASVAPKVTAIEQRAQVDLLELEDKRGKLEEERAEFAKWRQRRNLLRPARESGNAFNFFADLFLIAILEGALNLFFFTENNSLGILGAFFQAFLIAAANILLCCVVGFVAVKRVHSVFLLNKLIGAVSILVLLVGLPILHGVVGFYRIARQQTEVEGGSALWTAMAWARALEIERLDELSLIMTMVGIVAGAYAARKGYEFGDRYPDYSKRYWDVEDRRVDFVEEMTEVTEEMLDEQGAASAQTQNYLAELGSLLRSLESYTERKRELAAQLRVFEEHLEDVASTCLFIYRGANRSARSTAAPDHFEAKFRFQDRLFDGDRLIDTELHEALSVNENIAERAATAAGQAREAAGLLQERIRNVIDRTRAQLERGRALSDEPT